MRSVVFKAGCYGLQKLLDICSAYGEEWDIKFNPEKSCVGPIGGNHPSAKVELGPSCQIFAVERSSKNNILVVCLGVNLVMLTLQVLLASFMVLSTVLCMYLDIREIEMKWLLFS